MPVPFKPHTLTVNLPSAVVQANVLNGYGDSLQGDVKGLLYPVESGTMFQRFNVETSRGHAFLCDLADAPKFEEGGRCTMGDRNFAIKGEAMRFEGLTSADCTEVPLEEID